MTMNTQTLESKNQDYSVIADLGAPTEYGVQENIIATEPPIIAVPTVDPETLFKTGRIELVLQALKPYFFENETLSDATEEHWEDHMRTAIRHIRNDTNIGFNEIEVKAVQESVMNLLKKHGELNSRPCLRGFEDDHLRKLCELYFGGQQTLKSTPEAAFRIIIIACHIILHCRRENLLDEQTETPLAAAVDLVHAAWLSANPETYPIHVHLLNRSQAEKELAERVKAKCSPWLLRFMTPRLEVDPGSKGRVTYGWNIVLSCITAARVFVHIQLVACKSDRHDYNHETAYFLDHFSNSHSTLRFIPGMAEAICEGYPVRQPEKLRYLKRQRMTLNCIVWWDYDNVPVPRNQAVDKVVAEIKKYCSTMARHVVITAFGNALNVTPTKRGEIERAGVHFCVVNSKVVDHKDGRSEEVDKEMIAVMAPSLRQRGDVCVVISGDSGFQRHMERLLQQGCDVVLIYAGTAERSFTDDARWKASISWVKLLSIPSLKADIKPCHHFNRNTCSIDKDCKFAHICSSCGSDDHGSFCCPNLGRKVPECKYFVLGGCKFGNKCRHIHICHTCRVKSSLVTLDTATARYTVSDIHRPDCRMFIDWQNSTAAVNIKQNTLTPVTPTIVTPAKPQLQLVLDPRLLPTNFQPASIPVPRYVPTKPPLVSAPVSQRRRHAQKSLSQQQQNIQSQPQSLRGENKKQTLLDNQCGFGFFCPEGNQCQKHHTKAEKECFENNGGRGPKKYRTEMCREGAECAKQNCNYAHNQGEMVCYFCTKRGDHIGRNCPKRNLSNKK